MQQVTDSLFHFIYQSYYLHSAREKDGQGLQRVYIIINLQSSISRILSHLLLSKLQIFSYLLLINTIFQFDNNLSDVHRLNPCHSRFIGSQYTPAKPASQRFAELMASLFAYLIIFMFYIHINQVEERWIMKSSSLLQNTLIQAFILNHEHGTNIAFMSSASMHQLDAQYGNKFYNLNEKNLYSSLIFETNFTHQHNLSVGLSVNHDYLGQRANVNVSPRPTVGKENSPYLLSEMQRMNEKETTPGAYAQYTYTLGTKLTAMAGVRFDHSSLYGSFFTPRFHVKYSPVDAISIRLSAGKGYRTVFGLAEYNYLLASGREFQITGDGLKQEEAWNYGMSTAFYIPMFGKTLKLNAEYYYTDFKNQAVVDYDANKGLISIYNLMGKSYSHTFQIDASYPLLKGLEITAAYRLNDVKCTYDYGKTLKEKPLTSKYKALFTASYKTPLGLWQFDATMQLNGGGRNPEPYQLADGSQSWSPRFHSFRQVSAQVTRWFRHWSIYVGGENLTGFKQKTPIYGASNPWGSDFEPTLVWGPVEGRMFYAGVRVHF